MGQVIMKSELLRDLVCPTCKGDLEVHDFNAVSSEGSRADIETGVLTCEKCRTLYPIQNGVPILLIFSTPYHREFLNRHRDVVNDIGLYQLPGGDPEPGERDVQESFTDEWNALKDDEITFLYTDEELLRLHRDVWLQWEVPPKSIRRILNLGCGYGKESEILQKIVPGAEVYAIDLNFSLLNKGQRATSADGIHFVIASVFHLPFKEKSFDLVYSQGVIHHTYSTRRAYSALQKLARDDGYLFVWVYAAEDAFVLSGWLGIITRLRWLLETILRPPISRLPRRARQAVISMIAVLVHPLILLRVRHRQRWGFKNSLHLTYDYLGPRYASKHSFNEVIEWFEKDGFRIQVQSPSRYREIFGKRLWGVGVLGYRPAVQRYGGGALETSRIL